MDSINFPARVEHDLKRARAKRDRLARRLERANREVAQLEAASVVIDRYVTKNGDSALASGDDDGSTLLDYAVSIIVKAPEPMSVPDVADAIVDDPDYEYSGSRATLIRSLRGLVSKAFQEGRVARVERGMYGPPDRTHLAKEDATEDA